MTENEAKNKELAGLLGVEVLDFTTRYGIVYLLEVMMGREDWSEFADLKCFVVGQSAGEAKYYIPTDYITDKTGKLRDACLEWMRKVK
jgi:hypothetical protein